MAKKIIPTKDEEMTVIKLALSLGERMNFNTIFPLEGSIAENALGEALSKRVDFSPAEIKEWQISVFPDGKYSFNPQKAQPREFRFEPFEILYIQQGARFLEMDKKLRPFNYKLAERILSIKVKAKED